MVWLRRGVLLVVAIALAGLALPRSPWRAMKNVRATDLTEIATAAERVLVQRCQQCHGADKQEADLRLDDIQQLVQRQIIIPGDSAASLLLHMVSGDKPQMPPNDPLSAKEIAVLRQWVDEVVPTLPAANQQIASAHWSFRKPERPALPHVETTAWARNEIDQFVLARLEQEELSPSAEVERATFIRRVSLDLIGIPPTIGEVDEFLHDPEEDAVERLVDRLLASPQYGEQWGRHWLDLARYADTHGYHRDLQRQIWMYRDWVISAFNRNLPFDQFTVEQLAGDLLASPSKRQLIATGFHRNSMYNQEGGADEMEFRVKAIVDRVEVTSAVWLGMTMQCAQCHNHPNDPITQREFYELYAFFNSSLDRGAGKDVAPFPLLMFSTESEKAELNRLEAHVAERRVQAEKESGDLTQDEELHRRAVARDKYRAGIRSTMIMSEEAKPQPTHVLLRGDHERPGPRVHPNVPRIWPRLPADAPRNRLGLAMWLVSPENPLTARVTVNRFWEKLFGIGLVETSHDFGTQGLPPSHPELLDCLATEFQTGWDVKRQLRMIVTSATYRQTSAVSDELLACDPKNRWMSRGPRYRLEAETIRDNALAISGLLSRQIGGPSVFPPQPANLWKDIEINYENDLAWNDSAGSDRYRRGTYTFWRRSMAYPSLVLFDAPSREHCTVSRFRTSTPLQALALLNDPVFTEAAEALASRLTTECDGSTADRIAYGLRLCLARGPTEDEITILVRLFETERDSRQGNEHNAWNVVANVLLNLHATISNW